MPTRPPSWAATPRPCCRGSDHERAGYSQDRPHSDRRRHRPDRRRHDEIRRAGGRCRQDRRVDAGGGSHRRRRAWRVPPAAICEPAETRLDQCAPEYQGQAQRAGHRAGRRRQRHGPSGRRAHGGNRHRAGARMRRRLGRLPHVGPCRRSRRLCRAAAQGRHDRHLFGGGERQPHAARRRRRAAARHQSAGDRDPRPGKSRRWCSTSRPRSSPTAPSRTTNCRTARCRATG